MPHSPRIHNGELWLLNSGSGELGVVKRDENGKGHFEAKQMVLKPQKLCNCSNKEGR